MRYAEKIKPTIKDVSLKMKQQKLSNKLAAQGYEYDVINAVMRNLSFSEDERNQLASCLKAAQKAQKRYQTKYQGSPLRNRVYNDLAQKGFESDDIQKVISEMEWANEQS
jgi:1,2-diacylglycerol 3-alpha-glucosyltransferase